MSGRMRRVVEAALGIVPSAVEEDVDSSSSDGEGDDDSDSSSSGELLVFVWVCGNRSPCTLLTIKQKPIKSCVTNHQIKNKPNAEEEEKGRLRDLVASLSRMGFSEKQGRHAVRAVERRWVIFLWVCVCCRMCTIYLHLLHL
jgi:hypothetical protein